MQTDVGLVWIGALLVVGGVLFTAAKALWPGRLSEARTTGSARDTLEPRGTGARLHVRAIWPGLALIGLGALLLLAGSAL
jgi:hypothetical protein